MQKLSTRYGSIFVCAWLPPTFPMVNGFIVVKFCAGPYRKLGELLARTLPVGMFTVFCDVVDAFARWVCVGNCWMLRVTLSDPPTSPSVCLLWPPVWIGKRPR